MLRHFNYKLNPTGIIALVLLGLGTGLRLLLFWANPPDNAYDNHFEPINFIIQYGFIPPKAACWECYHPPLFYYISAKIGLILLGFGVSEYHLLKALQFLSSLFGIANLGVIYLVLKRLPISNFSRLITFGTICFLPVHLYMSAIHSNDTVTYFFVSLCIYLALVAADKNFPYSILIILSIVLSLTLLTKYTALVILPTIGIIFVSAIFRPKLVSHKRLFSSLIITMFVPILILGQQVYSNVQSYGKPFPMNIDFFPKKTDQIPGKELSFFTFNPWAAIKTPILSPENVKSFWTVIYGRMWFDMEPKFLYFTDNNPEWWKKYFDYLHGKNPVWPGVELSTTTILQGSALIALGLVPLLLMIYGGFSCLRKILDKTEKYAQGTKLSMFPILFACNTVGIVLFTAKYPVFSFMKASYFLNSLPAFAAFLGLGIEIFDRWKVIRYFLAIYFFSLYILVASHILRISASLLLR